MPTPHDILRRFYGYSSFRPGQEEIIAATIAGSDSLVLMPTGGGKSLCYQIPALILPGTAIVVSPLIALMNDQVQSLQANGVPAVALHSNQDESANRHALDLASQGKIKILYISPERLMSDIAVLSSILKVSLVAIDEAHCISQWGHDFRPVYTELKAVKERFPGVPVMALTATADRLTRADISKALGLNDPFSWIGSFDRPNLSLQVIPDPGKKGRLRVIASMIDRNPMDAGIVYCLSRKKTEDMNAALLEMGYRSVCYHAGMHPSERERSQRLFVSGHAQVVCATIAFGMGIDKSNIRWVVHNNIPGNIESYYQEIGRAGRDGLPAQTVLFYNFGDIITRQSFVEESGQREVNREKLQFMQRYAEATVCRRRILLSYFSEEATCDCGNCDNCRSPRAKFDGTILAQKALSAIIRINCAEGLNVVIDILRGLSNSGILQKRYNLVKTYGAGRDLSSREWHSYLLQMVQLGLIEVAYEDNFHLRPTPLGMKVVRGEQRIELSKFQEQNFSGYSRRNPAPEVVSKSPKERLLDKLKERRQHIADLENIPPHAVFSDASLQDMADKVPVDFESFSKISGVSEAKLQKYAKKFLVPLRKFKGLRGALPIGYSSKETLRLHKNGMNTAEIAAIRGVSVSTVFSHFASLTDDDLFSDFRNVLPEEKYSLVAKAFTDNPSQSSGTIAEKLGLETHIVVLALAEQRWHTRHPS